MKCFVVSYWLIFSFFTLNVHVHGYGQGKKTKCFAIPTFPTKVEKVIKACQDEVKTNLIEDLLFAALNENPFDQSQHHHVLKEFEDHIFQHHDGSHDVHHASHHQSIHSSDPHYHHSDDHSHSDHHSSDHHHSHGSTDSHPHVNIHQHGTDEHNHHQTHTEVIHSSPESHHHKPAEFHHHAPTVSHHETTKIVEAHEALSHVLSANKPVDPHDNHHHISAILNKLRAENPNHHPDSETSNLKWHRRITKRSLFGKWKTKGEEVDEYHPTVITHEDRWLAGCLMQCVFRKNNAVDKHGYPTLDGLTDLYTAGNSEQAFFIHVLRSVDKCLKGASIKHHIYRGKTPLKGETCDVAFDVFDCVSDSITEYCS